MINGRINKFKIGSILILIVLSVVFLRLEAVAQDSVGVKLQPTIIEELVEPGQVFHSILKVTNISDSAKLFYLASKDIEGLSPEGAPIFSQEGQKTDYSLSSWIVFNQSTVNVGPNETKEVSFSVMVPRDAQPGGHFAGLFVSLKPPKLEKTGTGVGYEVATIISLQVAGDITDQARIREFATDKLIYTKAEVDFRTVVENLGNILVRARGPLEITDIFGKKVATLTVNDQGAVVLPDSTREFKTIWTGEGLTIGRYQAVLGLVYGGEGRKTITATTSFWVLPLNFILIILIGIIGFIVLFFTITHLYIRRKLGQLDGAGNQGKLSHGQGSGRSMIFSVVMLVVALIFIVSLMVLFA